MRAYWYDNKPVGVSSDFSPRLRFTHEQDRATSESRTIQAARDSKVGNTDLEAHFYKHFLTKNAQGGPGG